MVHASRLNVLRLAHEPALGGDARRIQITVNGVDLLERARRVEAEFTDASPRSAQSGDYRAPPLWRVKDVPSWLLGEELTFSPSGGDWSVLLMCPGCDEHGCWPLEARITYDDVHVRWSDFRQPHCSDWRHDALSFCFERAAYEAEIARFLTTEAG